MSSISSATSNIHKIEDYQKENKRVNKIYPLFKLLITIFYISICMSVSKYDFLRILSLIVYPLFLSAILNISFLELLNRIKITIPFILFIGILNPLFDKEIALKILGINVSYGMLSFLVLVLKSVFAVSASYLLIITTSIEDIALSLEKIKVPKMMVIIVLLIYRYIFLFLDEADKIFTAYSLRSPLSKGIRYKAWGSLVGQMLLRSFDRAQTIYESMLLRGFKGNITYLHKKELDSFSIVYAIVWISIILILRFTNIIEFLGGLFI